MVICGLIKVTLTGRNGPGAISAPGLKVGDRMLFATGVAGNGPSLNGYLEFVVSVDDELQYSGSFDWSAQTFEIVFVRGI
jgi:hypothetical protein